MTTEFYEYYWDDDLEQDMRDLKTALDQGWVSARNRVVDGQWEVKAPSGNTEVSFSVQLESVGASDEWNYLWYWEMGQKNNITTANVSNVDRSGIHLGIIPFVMVNGTTSFTVNGKRPFAYWIEFGYYWDEDPDVVINGWSGSTRKFYDGQVGNWAVPMPENTKLDTSIVYWEKSRLQFTGGSGVVNFNTGTSPVTLNLGSISTISK